MSPLAKQWLRDAAIYLLKALVFAVGSYLLMMVIYGGVRISFFGWIAIVILAFAIAYIPYVVQRMKSQTKKDGS